MRRPRTKRRPHRHLLLRARPARPRRVPRFHKKSDTINNEIIDLEADNDEGTMSVEIAMQWTTAYSHSRPHLYLTPSTTEGGMHEEGFRAALTSLANRPRQGASSATKDDNPHR